MLRSHRSQRPLSDNKEKPQPYCQTRHFRPRCTPVVLASLDVNIPRINLVRRKIPLFNKADWCSFHGHMISIHNSIQDMAMTCSVDDLWSTFKQGIITGIEKYIPHKFAKERNGKPWVKKPLQRLIAKRNRHYSKYRATGSRYHKDKYKQTKAQVQKGIRSSYWAYVEDIATSQETQASHGKCNKKFWSFIKHSRKQSSCIPDLKASDGSILTNSKAKANLLNQHFHSVFSPLGTPLQHAQHSTGYPCMPPIEIKTAGIDKLISELDEYINFKGMLEDLQWRTLEQRRTDCRLVLLFQIIHGLVQIPPTNYLQPSLNTHLAKIITIHIIISTMLDKNKLF